MPKLKTHKGASKRFKVTGSGKVKHNQRNRRHNTGWKSAKRMRKLRKGDYLTPAFEANIKRLLLKLK